MALSEISPRWVLRHTRPDGTVLQEKTYATEQIGVTDVQYLRAIHPKHTWRLFKLCTVSGNCVEVIVPDSKASAHLASAACSVPPPTPKGIKWVVRAYDCDGNRLVKTKYMTRTPAVDAIIRGRGTRPDLRWLLAEKRDDGSWLTVHVARTTRYSLMVNKFGTTNWKPHEHFLTRAEALAAYTEKLQTDLTQAWYVAEWSPADERSDVELPEVIRWQLRRAVDGKVDPATAPVYFDNQGDALCRHAELTLKWLTTTEHWWLYAITYTGSGNHTYRRVYWTVRCSDARTGKAWSNAYSCLAAATDQLQREQSRDLDVTGYIEVYVGADLLERIPTPVKEVHTLWAIKRGTRVVANCTTYENACARLNRYEAARLLFSEPFRVVRVKYTGAAPNNTSMPAEVVCEDVVTWRVWYAVRDEVPRLYSRLGTEEGGIDTVTRRREADPERRWSLIRYVGNEGTQVDVPMPPAPEQAEWELWSQYDVRGSWSLFEKFTTQFKAVQRYDEWVAHHAAVPRKVVKVVNGERTVERLHTGAAPKAVDNLDSDLPGTFARALASAAKELHDKWAIKEADLTGIPPLNPAAPPALPTFHVVRWPLHKIPCPGDWTLHPTEEGAVKACKFLRSGDTTHKYAVMKRTPDGRQTDVHVPYEVTWRVEYRLSPKEGSPAKWYQYAKVAHDADGRMLCTGQADREANTADWRVVRVEGSYTTVTFEVLTERPAYRWSVERRSEGSSVWVLWDHQADETAARASIRRYAGEEPEASWRAVRTCRTTSTTEVMDSIEPVIKWGVDWQHPNSKTWYTMQSFDTQSLAQKFISTIGAGVLRYWSLVKLVDGRVHERFM